MQSKENVLRRPPLGMIPDSRLRAAAHVQSGRARATGGARRAEQQGQLTIVVAVPEPSTDHHWVLIGSYRRLEAMQPLGENPIWVDAWKRLINEAPLAFLLRGPERAGKVIVESALFEELARRHGDCPAAPARE